MKKVLTTLSIFAVVLVMATTAMASGWQTVAINGLDPVKGVESKTRFNSSGDKIPSNSHSGKFPGLFFNWVGKNNNDMRSFLQVHESVFDRFEGETFSITLQFTNKYFEYEIAKSAGKPLASNSSIYAYEIDRNISYIHNNGRPVTDKINQVNQAFIDGFYNNATIIVEKRWIDEDFNAIDDRVSFTNGFKLGRNDVEVGSWDSTTVSFSENDLVGYRFLKAELYEIVDGKEVVRQTFGRNISFNVIGDGVYRIRVINTPIYYTVNYWNTNEFSQCRVTLNELGECDATATDGTIRELWYTEQVRHGYPAVGRMRDGRPWNPTLVGYTFNGWVDAADLVDVTGNVDVYATWAFNAGDGVWIIPNVSSWQPLKWGSYIPANQAAQGKNVSIAEARFGSMTNDGYCGAIIFEDDFFKKYDSVTFTFYSGQGNTEGIVAMLKFTSFTDWVDLTGNDTKELEYENGDYHTHYYQFAASGTQVAITDLVIKVD